MARMAQREDATTPTEGIFTPGGHFFSRAPVPISYTEPHKSVEVCYVGKTAHVGRG